MNKMFLCLILALLSLSGCGSTANTNAPVATYTSGSVFETSKNTVATIAGSPGVAGSTDAVGTAARFKLPNGIAVSADKTTLYVADYGNNIIRMINKATGAVTTMAGKAGVSGTADGIGTAATFNGPHDIATDGTSLYVTDSTSNTIRKIDIATGVVTTLAGKAGVAGPSDGTGTAATFNEPLGITTDGTNLYVTDAGNNTIRKINISTRVVTTLAGSAGSGGYLDGTGSAAAFNLPAGITTDGTVLYVADFNNNAIRKIVISTGVVTTLAGSMNFYGSADSTGTGASFYGPNGITTDGTNLYVAESLNDTVRKIVISTGIVTTLAGSPAGAGSSNGVGSAARFYFPVGITTDGTSLYVADADNDTIRIIN